MHHGGAVPRHAARARRMTMLNWDLLQQVGMTVLYYLSPLLMLAGIVGFVTTITLWLLRS